MSRKQIADCIRRILAVLLSSMLVICNMSVTTFASSDEDDVDQTGFFNIYYNTSEYYTIDCPESEEEGEEIELIVNPTTGYGVKDVSVTYGDSNCVVSSMGLDTYTFIMPDKDVHINVTVEPLFSIEYGDIDHGEVWVDNIAAVSGTIITLTVRPNSGYVVDEVKCATSSYDLQLTANDDGTYSFEMPYDNVTVTATFLKGGSTDEGYYAITVADESNWGYAVDLDIDSVSAKPGAEVSMNMTMLNEDCAATPSVTTAEGTQIDLTENGEGGYVFTMPEEAVVVSISLTYYSTITVAETENGTVTVDKEKALPGDTIEVTVTPADGYILAKLVYGYNETITADDEGKYTFVLPEWSGNFTVTATFEAEGTEHSITVDNNSYGGTISVDKDSAAAGEKVVVTVKPIENYTCSSVTYNIINSIEKDDAGEYSFIMPSEDVTVQAYFEYGNGGSVVQLGFNIYYNTSEYYTIGCPESEEADRTVSLTVTPISGYGVADVSVIDGNNESVKVTPLDEGNYEFIMPAVDVTVYVTVGQLFSINFANMDHGEVEADYQAAASGTTVTLTVRPDNGYVVDEVKYSAYGYDNLLTANDDGTYSFKMPYDNVTVTVTFQKGGSAEDGYHAIEINNPNAYAGKLTSDCSSAKAGDTVTLTPMPYNEYEFGSLTVEDSEDSIVSVTANDDGTYSFVMPDLDVVVKVIFGEPLDISVVHSVGGTITVDKAAAVPGSIVTGTAVADEGYFLDVLNVNGYISVETDENGAFSFEMPYGNTEVTATWVTGKPEFATHALTLGEQIGVIFYMDLPEDLGYHYEDSNMRFTVEGDDEEETVQYRDGISNTDGTRLGFVCYVSSIQMADTITAEFHYFTEDWKQRTVKETYSVADYISMFMEKAEEDSEQYAGTVPIVQALADLGHYSQLFFSDYRGWSIGGDHIEMPAYSALDGYSDDEIDGIKDEVSDEGLQKTLAGDIAKVTYNVDLDSSTAIRLYFKPTGECEEGATATVNGSEADVEVIGSRYLVTVSGINAHNLGDRQSVEFTTSSGVTTADVSVLSYVRSMLNNPYNDQMTDLMAALYKYYQESVAYSS